MRAVVFDRPGDESVLEVGEVPSPTPGPGEMLIRVATAGVNRADLLQRRGLYPPPPGASPILGLECGGHVEEPCPGATGFRPGDRVMALLTGGGYAELVAVPVGCVMPVPDPLADAEAGGLPEAFLTAFLNLFQLGGLETGQTALVHGGSGGVGTAAITLCRLAGARVVVTAGSDERCRRCLDHGADAALNYRTEDLAARVLELTGGTGVDVVLDCVGAPYLDLHTRVLALGGRLVLIGLQGGSRGEVDLRAVLSRHLTLLGSTLRSRPADEKAAIIRGFLDRFGADLEAGRLRPVVDRTLPFERAGEAHRLLASGAVYGKVVLVPWLSAVSGQLPPPSRTESTSVSPRRGLQARHRQRGRGRGGGAES